MKAKRLLLACTLLLFAYGQAQQTSPWRREIIYQIFERSFYDSNGDRIGDFKGIEEKLPYIAKLGATSILLQPINKSRFYHNYFADSFFEADPSLGGNSQFFELVKAAHRRHLKVILDMEPQYVASEHPWFKAGAPFVVPNSGIYGMRQVPIYTGARIGLDTFNLMRAENAAEIRKAFAFWAAPQGRVSDGVDGFRIDHMMDDLDNRHVNTNLLAGFWSPLEAELRRLKPGLFFVAEQSDWKSLGDSLFSSGGVDSVYAIPLRSAFIDAVAKQNGAELAVALDQEQSVTPPEKTQLTVIEDHDVLRWASAIHADPTLLRLAAAFQFAIQGTPSIYYGQELGMHGLQLKGRSDANDIPIRLAMPWETSPDAPGTATWYGPGPWLEAPESKLNAGISVAQEDADPGSLLNFYRKLIKIRRSSPALTIGDQKLLPTDNPHVLALSRSAGRQRIVALFNFSDQAQNVMIADHKSGRDLLTGQSQRLATTLLPSHGFQWIDLR